MQEPLQRRALAQQTTYFNTETSVGSELVRISEHIYTFHHYFDRTIVVDTPEGLVIGDPFSSFLTSPLREALREQGLDKPIHTVIYSHYHLDHVRGAEVLSPANVVAHSKCPGYWADFDPYETKAILPPTRLIDGDTSMRIGGTEIQLLYLGLSHTDTLYALYLPQESVLYAPDTVGVGVFLPVGGVSLYTPGYLRALDRMAALPFTTFMGSHFGWGPRDAFLAAVVAQRDIYGWMRSALRRHEGPVPPFQDRERLLAIYDEVYEKVKDKYSTLHGFDTQAFFAVVSAFVAAYVGG